MKFSLFLSSVFAFIKMPVAIVVRQRQIASVRRRMLARLDVDPLEHIDEILQNTSRDTDIFRHAEHAWNLIASEAEINPEKLRSNDELTQIFSASVPGLPNISLDNLETELWRIQKRIGCEVDENADSIITIGDFVKAYATSSNGPKGVVLEDMA